ncbi:MAG: tubulin-like doman-containing protein [Peptococcaceae bacterium]|nr:tubulin-like doman-containing protein [Peptococcaceae bacterium]
MLAPTLIVGLGGIGSKITAKLSAMITDERQRERINFVIFDTDVNELGKIKRENPFIHTVQTSTNMTVGDYLHLDEFTRDNSFPVNPNLYRKTLSEGAGQVRAISHLAFVTAMKRGGLEPLDSAIYDLYKLESSGNTQVLRVIIVSTLAGGTGSGLILPISMYIKQFLKTKIQIPGSITRGFFILPEILYGAVTAEPMRNAFKANAYAVLRELNAFILKADGNLPQRYQDKVHLLFPKAGTNQFEEYDVLPMDFTFMFDAQNIEGKKLNSTEQYLDHAATCIYAQSIGPMNTRSNSSEDNTIRTLVSGQSRNRYAGAGASELVYPSDHILRYIALKWATQTVSDHWTVFDRDYHKKSIDNNRARLKGHNVAEIDPATEYIRSVDAAAENGNAFAMFTRNASYRFDKDGFTEISCKWNEYIDALVKFVRSISRSGQTEIDNSRDTAQSAVDALTTGGREKIDMDIFRNAYNYLLSYKELVVRRVGDIGRVAAYELFKFNDGEDVTVGGLPTQIETYLRDNTKEFMHPNAARYFLYQVLQTLLKKLAEAEKKKELAEKAFKSFDVLFDDPDTDVIENIGDFMRKIDDAGFWARIRKRYEGEKRDYIEQFESLLGTVADYRVTAPYVMVLTAAVKYIRDLSKSFELFYKSFDGNVSEIERQIKTSEEKYRLNKGNAIRYVCTSKKCLDKFYEKMEFTGSALHLPGDLCMRIYTQVRLFGVSQEVKTSTFFKDIFDHEILRHFMTSVMEAYSTDIKMDIIRALEVEAEYEEGIQESTLITEYVKKVITETKKLSDPFINRPVGEEPVPIHACAFNKRLYLIDDPEREGFVNSELLSFGGVPSDDDEIDVERILFYSAIYGLFPYDLLKFSPPQKSKTVMLEAGEYNKAYFDMISRIEPDTLTTPVITPHLHKHWHLISEMPDLNDELQKEQEKTIYKALVLGLLYERIRYEKAGDTYKYSLWLKDSIKEIPLEVSNGAPCDTFYRVIDALTLNPVIVKKILSAIENELESARKNNVVKFEQGTLHKGINALTLRELSKDSRRMSIFGIAAAFKATTPPDDFILEQGLMLLETTLETLYEQIAILCPENERNSTYITIVESQLELFIGNFGLYKENHPSVIDDYLRMLLQVVIKVLISKGFAEAAERVNDFSKRQFCEDVLGSEQIPS